MVCTPPLVPIINTHPLTFRYTHCHTLLHTPPDNPLLTPLPPLSPSLPPLQDSYVGSDRFGWGIIGTRALWHGRAKIASDFGSGFGNQSIVFMRLDTDGGKLSISTDGDPVWYQAFDHLPTGIELFPAVSLYHREDKIMFAPTLSSDFSAGRGSNNSSSSGISKEGEGHANSGSKHLADHRLSIDVRLFMKYVLAMCAKIDSFLRIAERPGPGPGLGLGLGPMSSSSSSSSSSLGSGGGIGTSGTDHQHHPMSLVDRSAVLSHPFIGLLLPSLAAAIIESKPTREHTGFIAIHLTPAFTVLTRRLAALYDDLAVISREKDNGEMSTGVDGTDNSTSLPTTTTNNSTTNNASTSSNATDASRGRGGGGSLSGGSLSGGSLGGSVAATSYAGSAGGPWTVRSGTYLPLCLSPHTRLSSPLPPLFYLPPPLLFYSFTSPPPPTHTTQALFLIFHTRNLPIPSHSLTFPSPHPSPPLHYTLFIGPTACNTIPAQEYKIIIDNPFAPLGFKLGGVLPTVVPPNDPSQSTSTSTPSSSSSMGAGAGAARGGHQSHPSTTAAPGAMAIALVPTRIAGSGRCANATMTISGTHVGTRLKFLEKWSSGGSCLIDCRLSFCGNFFSGVYTDLKTGKSGPVEGYRTCLSWNTFASLRHVLFKSSLLSGMAVGKLSASLVSLASCPSSSSASSSSASASDRAQGLGVGVGVGATGGIVAPSDTTVDPSSLSATASAAAAGAGAGAGGASPISPTDAIPPPSSSSSDPIASRGGPTPSTPSPPLAGGEDDDKDRDLVVESHAAMVKWLQSDLLSGGLPMNPALVAYLIEEVGQLIDPIKDKEDKGLASVLPAAAEEDGTGQTFEGLTDWWINKVFPILKVDDNKRTVAHGDSDDVQSQGQSQGRDQNQSQSQSSSLLMKDLGGKGPILTTSMTSPMTSPMGGVDSDMDANANANATFAGTFLTDLLANRHGAQRLDEYVVHHIGQV